MSRSNLVGWVAPRGLEPDGSPGGFAGYIEAAYENPPKVIEESRTFATMEDAITWAKARAVVVLARFTLTKAEYYSVGDADPGWHPFPRHVDYPRGADGTSYPANP
jgi:hypothetical protein